MCFWSEWYLFVCVLQVLPTKQWHVTWWCCYWYESRYSGQHLCQSSCALSCLGWDVSSWGGDGGYFVRNCCQPLVHAGKRDAQAGERSPLISILVLWYNYLLKCWNVSLPSSGVDILHTFDCGDACCKVCRLHQVLSSWTVRLESKTHDPLLPSLCFTLQFPLLPAIVSTLKWADSDAVFFGWNIYVCIQVVSGDVLLIHNGRILGFGEETTTIPSSPIMIGLAGRPGEEGKLRLSTSGQLEGNRLELIIPFRIKVCHTGYLETKLMTESQEVSDLTTSK